MLKSTRAEAKEAGERHYFTGKACKNGHIDKRLTSTGGCLSCYRELHANLKGKNPDYKARQDAARTAWSKTDRGIEKTKASVQRRREKIREQRKKRRSDGQYKQVRKDYYQRVLKNSPQYKIRHNVATRIRGILKGEARGNTVSKIIRLCGYTIDELRFHLERQFTRGMSWENYGLNGWHIDHITPAATFDMTDDKQFAACWSLANLRPLWGKDNMIKGKSAHFLL